MFDQDGDEDSDGDQVIADKSRTYSFQLLMVIIYLNRTTRTKLVPTATKMTPPTM